MRLLPILALSMSLLAGGIVGDAFARDRDRDDGSDRDRKHERYERRDDDRSRRDESRRDDNRSRRDESRRDESRYDDSRSRRDESRRDEDRSRRDESRGYDNARGYDNPYFGGRESSFVDRRGSSEGRSASRITAGQAARQAQQEYGGGRVLSVDSMGDGYRVKLLRDGDVRVVFISGR